MTDSVFLHAYATAECDHTGVGTRIIAIVSIALTTLGILSPSCVRSQSVNKSKLDTLFNRIDHHGRAMCSIAIAKNGEILYQRQIGYEDIAENMPATAESEYRLGSISKMFTAVMIFQLIEEHQLTLETKLAKYFPQIPNAKDITIEEMLDHHSGIYDLTHADDVNEWATKPLTEKQVISKILNGKPQFEPGAKGEYSNSNFVLLGYIVERVTRKSYVQNLEERITKRIGLAHTYYGGKIGSRPHEAKAYYYGDQAWDPVTIETSTNITAGAGSIVSNPTDMIHFLDALFRGSRGGLVSDSSLQQMRTMHGSYGLGMVRFPFGTRWIYGHNGKVDTYESMLGRFPDDSLEIALVGNAWDIDENDVVVDALSAIYFRDWKVPSFEKYNLTPGELAAYEGTYSSKNDPMKIAIKVKDGELTGQATGQDAFPLEPTGKDVFQFTAADLKILFHRSENHSVSSFDIIQSGHSELYTK